MERSFRFVHFLSNQTEGNEPKKKKTKNEYPHPRKCKQNKKKWREKKRRMMAQLRIEFTRVCRGEIDWSIWISGFLLHHGFHFSHSSLSNPLQPAELQTMSYLSVINTNIWVSLTVLILRLVGRKMTSALLQIFIFFTFSIILFSFKLLHGPSLTEIAM